MRGNRLQGLRPSLPNRRLLDRQRCRFAYAELKNSMGAALWSGTVSQWKTRFWHMHLAFWPWA